MQIDKRLKIVLVNYRYFVSGGPERYMFNIKKILESKGHSVIPFSVAHNLNEPSEYNDYFLSPIGDGNVTYFNEYFQKSIKSTIKILARMFFSFEAKRKFKKLLIDTKPDIIYIIQYHNKISPSILFAAKAFKIPVIHRISDFQYMCPNALFYNDVKGICEDCLHKKAIHCVSYKCVLNSKIHSFIKLAAKEFHNLIGTINKIDAFVIPSSFTLGKLNYFGIPQQKLNHIPTFFPLDKSNNELIEYTPFFLFVGRIEHQKGLKTLVDAFVNTDYILKIIGFSNDNYENELKEYIKSKNHKIEFLGKKSFQEMIPYLTSCICTIVPSEWYDNFPNVILESFAFRKPVIATNIGSLPELVIHNQTGLCFDYASVESLREKLTYFINSPQEAKRMGDNAYQKIISDYSQEEHYQKLLTLFENEIVRKNTH